MPWWMPGWETAGPSRQRTLLTRFAVVWVVAAVIIVIPLACFGGKIFGTGPGADPGGFHACADVAVDPTPDTELQWAPCNGDDVYRVERCVDQNQIAEGSNGPGPRVDCSLPNASPDPTEPAATAAPPPPLRP